MVHKSYDILLIKIINIVILIKCHHLETYQIIQLVKQVRLTLFKMIPYLQDPKVKELVACPGPQGPTGPQGLRGDDGQRFKVTSWISVLNEDFIKDVEDKTYEEGENVVHVVEQDRRSGKRKMAMDIGLDVSGHAIEYDGKTWRFVWSIYR